MYVHYFTFQTKYITHVKIIFPKQKQRIKRQVIGDMKVFLLLNLIINIYTQLFAVARQNEIT